MPTQHDRPSGHLGLFQLVDLARRLQEVHNTVSALFEDRWPAHRDPWVAIIRAKAERENLAPLGAAVALAKESPNQVQAMIILAAAYEIAQESPLSRQRAG